MGNEKLSPVIDVQGILCVISEGKGHGQIGDVRRGEDGDAMDRTYFNW